MPLELGPISVVGRIIDFSIPGTSRESMMPDYMHDILDLLIRALENVTQWIFDNAYRFDMQHKDNIAAIDFEIDQEIKGAGGLNMPMDVSTSSKIITREKNILVTLYMAKENEADRKVKASKGSGDGSDVQASKRPSAGSFTQAGKMRVIVNTPKLLDWAQRYEFARLSEVYSETARRLKEKQQKLALIEVAKATNLRDAKEQARHKQYPSAPPGVSLDENLEFAKSQKAYFSIKGRGFLLSWFYTQVRNKGEWDYKKGQPQYESFGNFNYGAVGTAAGISEAVLLRAAGAAQSLAGTSQAEFDKWWSEAPYGDDPVDQVWIKAGIDYAKSKGY